MGPGYAFKPLASLANGPDFCCDIKVELERNRGSGLSSWFLTLESA
jgi:hypothetical protein